MFTKNTNVFTKQEIDFLVSEISKVLNTIECDIIRTKDSMDRYYWNYEESVEKYRPVLNFSKATLKKLKKKRKSYADIQSKMKKLRGA